MKSRVKAKEEKSQKTQIRQKVLFFGWKPFKILLQKCRRIFCVFFSLKNSISARPQRLELLFNLGFQFSIRPPSRREEKRRKDKMLQFISWLEGANQNKRFFCQEDRFFWILKYFIHELIWRNRKTERLTKSWSFLQKLFCKFCEYWQIDEQKLMMYFGSIVFI